MVYKKLLNSTSINLFQKDDANSVEDILLNRLKHSGDGLDDITINETDLMAIKK